MTLLYETKFSSLFEDLRGQTKFEASGVEALNETFFTIFDSLEAVGVTPEELHRFTPSNALVGPIGEEDSDFEGIAYHHERDTIMVVQEAVPSAVHEGFHPWIWELELKPGDTDYKVLDKCVMDVYIEHGNKGIEEIEVIESNGEVYVLGLCEGNHCKGGREGRDRGNGRIIVSKETRDPDTGKCKYVCVKVIDIPGDEGEANFQDYSGLDMKDNLMMISSQEDSAIWIGTFDFKTMEIDGTLAVFEFPRTSTCQQQYCNIEGVAWMDDLRIVATSDKAKSRQEWSCSIKDQSIHQFMFPNPLPEQATPRRRPPSNTRCPTVPDSLRTVISV
eukprot:jgi/Botrbrau1/23228/Bobra.0041s0070.2